MKKNFEWEELNQEIKKSEYVISPSNTKVSIKSFQIYKSIKDEYVSGECIGLELNEKILLKKEILYQRSPNHHH